MNYIIIGNGPAGINAAKAIRDRDSDGQIQVLTRERFLHYSRIKLPDLLMGKSTEDALYLKPQSWYHDNRIDVLYDQQVTQVDPVRRQVLCAGQPPLIYDKLCIATGAAPFVPPIDNLKLPGVFTLRTIEDVLAIQQHLGLQPKKIVMIGGGLLGLEAANALRLMQHHITIIELCDRLLPRQLDQTGSQLIEAQLRALGFDLFLGQSITRISGTDQVSGIVLADQQTLACDMVLVSVGVRPVIPVVPDLALISPGFIAVDDYMHTNLPDIWAAGDVIEHKETRYGLWAPAMQQGQIAGANMAGDACEYAGSAMAAKLKFPGISVFSLGTLTVQPTDIQYRYISEDRTQYRSILCRHNHIAGALLVGESDLAMPIQTAWQAKTPLDQLTPLFTRALVQKAAN